MTQTLKHATPQLVNPVVLEVTRADGGREMIGAANYKLLSALTGAADWSAHETPQAVCQEACCFATAWGEGGTVEIGAVTIDIVKLSHVASVIVPSKVRYL